MASFHDITTDQLRQMIQLRERIDFLQDTLRRLRGDAPTKAKRKVGRPAEKRTMSAVTARQMTTTEQAKRRHTNRDLATTKMFSLPQKRTSM